MKRHRQCFHDGDGCHTISNDKAIFHPHSRLIKACHLQIRFHDSCTLEIWRDTDSVFMTVTGATQSQTTTRLLPPRFTQLRYLSTELLRKVNYCSPPKHLPGTTVGPASEVCWQHVDEGGGSLYSSTRVLHVHMWHQHAYFISTCGINTRPSCSHVAS